MKENKPKGMFNEKLSKYEQLLVDFHKEIGRSKRVNEKFITIGTYLLLYSKLTQSDLVELTGFSSGTISTYLSVMEGMGIIDKRRIPKTHTYEYGIHVPINEIIIERYDESLESVLALKAILSKKNEELNEFKHEQKAGADLLSKRVKELLKALDYYEEFIAILK